MRQLVWRWFTAHSSILVQPAQVWRRGLTTAARF
ncbi:Uncharacterised protein [Vibrio cholerae]|nr:Uncharacterised protein [Vibrio cholerae]